MIPGINLHYCRHFIRHYYSATRIDVLHSPFIFDLYQTCIKPKTQLAQFLPIEQLRSALKKDRTPVSQLDLGGTQALTKERSVSELAFIHAKPARIAQILYRITEKYRYRNLVELGTSLGLSTAYHAQALKQNFAASEASFYTIEGAPGLVSVAARNFETLGLSDYIKQRTGNFDEVLPEVLQRSGPLDYAFIDGNHRYGPTLDYFMQLLPKTHNDSVLVFDDIYWSAGMKRAWEEIRQHPDVRQTVDLFFIGLVFFRKEQAKEHFRLRIL